MTQAKPVTATPESTSVVSPIPPAPVGKDTVTLPLPQTRMSPQPESAPASKQPV